MIDGLKSRKWFRSHWSWRFVSCKQFLSVSRYYVLHNKNGKIFRFSKKIMCFIFAAPCKTFILKVLTRQKKSPVKKYYVVLNKWLVLRLGGWRNGGI